MELKKLEKLIIKFMTKSISASELDELSNLLDTHENELIFLDYIRLNYAIDFNMSDFNTGKAKLMFLNNIEEKVIPESKKFRIRIFWKYAAAVAVVLLVSTHLLTKKTKYDFVKTPVVSKQPILPGSDKATLTLEDGSNITLEKGQSYETKNLNSNGSELVYQDTPDSEVTSKPNIAYNYLTIPRGGQFFVKLSDGTQVWLNSETKIKYPVKFIDDETRQVELIYGEAYFDVSPSTKHNGEKFKVITKIQEVEVLGTEFNIKAYSDENSIYTTLVEGKVAVDFGFEKKTLNPNQQSIINIDNKNISIDFVDVYNETSWKNGIFSFKGKALKDIMKVLSRWYDIEVIFLNKELEEVKFIGVLKKNQNIEDILLTIKNTNFINAYEIKNNTIILK